MKSLTDLAASWRNEFPALSRPLSNGKELVYLDTAATALKPKSMIQRLSDFYSYESANVHRGAYYLSDQATSEFEKARKTVANFLGVVPEEIIFTRNTTEAVNLVAFSWAKSHLKAGQKILVTELEHHANLVPWQLLAQEKNLNLGVVRISDQGQLDLEDFEKQLTSDVGLVAVTGCSNALGTMPDLDWIGRKVREKGARLLVDGAQLVTQKRLSLSNLPLDFFVFSGHKIFGPTGIGVLWAPSSILSSMPPWQGGGSMISQVILPQGTTFQDPPHRFEAGTPHIAGVIGLAAALSFVEGVDFSALHQWEQGLLSKAEVELGSIPGLRLYGTHPGRGAILSFNLGSHHHSDVAQILDQQGVSIRAGHHCCQPLMKRLGVKGTLRASFSIYNNEQDVRALVSAVRKAQEILS